MTFDIGGYRATELLAAGASAQVWRGQRMSDGEAVALKVFPPDQLPAVRREAALAAAVDHPHVVTVLDVVADEHRVALVTEYAAGGDLADLLARRGRLTPGQTLTVLIPLAAALATAHERQVVHGDVSAGNVVFDLAGRPLLADLGAARAAMESGRPVQATPCDAAPELARAGAPTPATDLFSLGSVALACLTGRPAWPADDLRDVVIQAAAGQWPDLPDDAAPAALVAAVRSLLEHDPERRPGAASLVLDLRSAGRPEPLDVMPEEPGGGRRRRAGEPTRGAAPVPHPGRRRHGRDDEDRDAVLEPATPPWGAAAVHRNRLSQPSGDAGSAATAPARALTRARADASGTGASPGRDEDAGRSLPARLRSRMVPGPGRRSRTALRVAALAVAGVLVALAAGFVGLRWADSGRADPIAVQQLSTVSGSRDAAGGPGIPASAQPPAVPPGRSTVRTATPTVRTGPPTVPTGLPTVPTGTPKAATRPPPSTMPPPAMPPPTTPPPPGARPVVPESSSPSSSPPSTRPTAGRPADWAATVAELDRARSRALVSRDPALLDAVYTSASTARSADAATIRTLVARGLRVSGAQHHLQSVQPMTGAAATVLVRDSLPSYDVLSSTGSVVGRTPERAAAPRVMVLVDTPSGYRISEVRVP